MKQGNLEPLSSPAAAPYVPTALYCEQATNPILLWRSYRRYGTEHTWDGIRTIRRQGTVVRAHMEETSEVQY